MIGKWVDHWRNRTTGCVQHKTALLTTLFCLLLTSPTFAQTYKDPIQACPPGQVFKTTEDDPIGKCHCIGNADARTQKLTTAKGSLGGCSTSRAPRTTADFTNVNGTNGFSISVNVHKEGMADINGDNIDDLILSDITATPAETGRASSGALYIIFGIAGASPFANPFNLATLNGTTGVKIMGAYASHDLRFEGTGDFNGDGYDDLLLVDSQWSVTQPNGFIVFGKATQYWNATLDMLNIAMPDGIRFGKTGNTPIPDNDGLSSTVWGHVLGDINGDGYDDVVFVEEVANDSWVIFGKANWSSTSNPFDVTTLNGTTGFQITDGTIGFVGSSFPASNQVAGDFNNDGYDDFIIKNWTASAYDTFYIVFGRSTWASTFSIAAPDGTSFARLIFPITGGPAPRCWNGTVGDFNGDHYADMFLSCTTDLTNIKPTLYGVFGKASGWASSFTVSTMTAKEGFTITGTNSMNDGLFLTAFDADNDGYDDVMINQFPSITPPSSINKLLYGRAQWPSTMNISTLNNTTTRTFTPTVTNGRYIFTGTAGDINADGYTDYVFRDWDSAVTYLYYGVAP
jgi:hypothetical protein